jgi:magnesium transporter
MSEADVAVAESPAPIATSELIEQAHDCLEHGRSEELQELLAGWPSSETAAVIEALPQPDRFALWRAVPETARGDVLAWLGDQVRTSLLRELEVDEAVAAAASMESPDLADVVDEVPRELREAILDSLMPEVRTRVEDTLAYPEDSAGRLMDREWIAVRGDVTLEVVKRYLRFRGRLPQRTTSLMVVDDAGHFLGKLYIERLLTEDPELLVDEVMDGNAISVNVTTPLPEVALLFQRRDLFSLPVVDDDGLLVGRIILDDAIDLIRSEAEEPMMHMAGLDVDEDLLAPVMVSARRRMLWLGINLVTAFLAAWVIGLFEATLDRIVALAILMPIVASMGGIAGSQTLTLAIRGLAMGQITDANTRWLAVKEISISVINGVVWALVVGIIAWFWFGQVGISLVLGAAMVINLLVAALSGLAVPLLLDRMGIDPALSGSVVLTTVTDVVGFISFLGLATLFLL